MRVLSLCSGVGGLDLGVRLAVPAARTVCYVEREAYAAAVLAARMADGALDEAPVVPDLCGFDGRPWGGEVDCVIAGFPCQPFSLAGKGLGEADDRWLWGDVERVVREVGPRYVFLENVPGLVRRGLDRVVGGLAELGFDAEWALFSAAGSGAPHLRKRWFLLAAHPERSDLRDQRERVPGGRLGGVRAQGHPEPRDDGAAGHVADADRARPQGRDRRELQERPGELAAGSGCARRAARQWWPPEPPIRRVVARPPAVLVPMLEDAIREAEHATQASAARYLALWEEMQQVLVDAQSPPTPPGLPPAHERRDPVRKLSRERTPRCATEEVQGLLENLHRRSEAALVVWRREVCDRAWASLCATAMEGSPDDEGVRVLWQAVPVFEGAPDDLLEVVRQQAGVGAAPGSRVDELRAAGNGVVPAVAARAWRVLERRLDADG